MAAERNRCMFQYTLSGGDVMRDEKGEHHVGPGKVFLCQVRLQLEKPSEKVYTYPERYVSL